MVEANIWTQGGGLAPLDPSHGEDANSMPPDDQSQGKMNPAADKQLQGFGGGGMAPALCFFLWLPNGF